MSFQSTAQIKLYISLTQPATFDEDGYGALNPIEIGDVTQLDGDQGRTYNIVTFNTLSNSATQKQKGSYNNGQLTVTVAYNGDDAGHQAAEEALKQDGPAWFKIEKKYDNTNVVTVYFEGLVTKFTTDSMAVDAAITQTMMIEVTDRDVLRIK